MSAEGGGADAGLDGHAPVVRAGMFLAGVAGLGVLVANLVGVLVLDRRVSGLDAEREGNVLTWLASGAAGSAAVAALLLSFVPPARRALIIALGAGLAFLSLDEAAQIHERLARLAVRQLGASEDWEGRIQLVGILPVMALVFLTVALLALRARRPLRTSLLGALGLLVLSVLIEQIVGPFTNRRQAEGVGWPDAIRVGVEEGLEVAGWILLAAGLFAMLLLRWAQRGRARPA